MIQLIDSKIGWRRFMLQSNRDRFHPTHHPQQILTSKLAELNLAPAMTNQGGEQPRKTRDVFQTNRAIRDGPGG
ncbi:MAG: hypothetical protein ACI909_002276 [Planctomycetota bacterium]|jgi:hypothetical protein